MLTFSDGTCTILSRAMNHQKVEENVAKFLAIGFTRAMELVAGYPLVYRMQELENILVCREIYIVSEEVSPDSLPSIPV